MTRIRKASFNSLTLWVSISLNIGVPFTVEDDVECFRDKKQLPTLAGVGRQHGCTHQHRRVWPNTLVRKMRLLWHDRSWQHLTTPKMRLVDACHQVFHPRRLP